MVNILEILNCPRLGSSFLERHIKEVKLQYMVHGLLKQ